MTYNVGIMKIKFLELKKNQVEIKYETLNFRNNNKI